MDDIFAAVDGHVAAHIYRKCILGLLEEKTKVYLKMFLQIQNAFICQILCTHHSRFLAAADIIIVLKEGEIMAQVC